MARESNAHTQPVKGNATGGLDPDLRIAGIILALGMMMGAFIPNGSNESIVSAANEADDGSTHITKSMVVDPLGLQH